MRDEFGTGSRLSGAAFLLVAAAAALLVASGYLMAGLAAAAVRRGGSRTIAMAGGGADSRDRTRARTMVRPGAVRAAIARAVVSRRHVKCF